MTRWAAWAVALALATSAGAQGVRVEGTVADAEAGRPVAGASVLFTTADGPRGRATDADGRFAIDDVPSGPVALRVTAVGYAALDTSVVVSGGTTTLALRLRPATTTAAEVVVQARRSATATRADAPVLLVPQAVSVLPAGVLDAQGAHDLPDALRNVPGVSTRAVGEPGALPVLRGFRTDQTGGGVRRNGVEVPYLADGLRSNVARVEVLRGPASVLYGRLEPGGVVNVITETPEGRRHAEATGSGGTLGGGRLAVDVGGPVGAVATRLNASAEREGWGRGDATRAALFVAPAVRWRPSDRWVLDLDAEAVASETTLDPGLAALGADTGALDGTPRDRFFGEPDAVHRWRSAGAFATAAYAAGRADVRTTLSLARYDLRRDALDLDSLVTSGAPAVARSLQREGLGFTYLKGATFADLRLETGPVAHTVTVGAEAIRAWAQADGTAPLPRTAGGLRFGLVDPVDLDAPRPTGLDAEEVDYLDASVRGLDAGVFVQDRATVRLGRAAVHVVGAARVSHVRFGATIRALADTPEAPAGIGERSAQVTAVTPSAGVVVEPRPGLALYLSSGASFNPVVERVDRDGEPFRPTRGVQVEGGAKLDAGWLAASAAAFWIRKDDALTVGPGGFFDQTGRQRSRGVEAEVRAQGAGLVGLATYTLLDAEVVADDNVPAGTPLAYAPRHAGSAWVEARRGVVAVRGGVWAQGARSGGLGGGLVLPAEATVDVGVEAAVRRGVSVRFDVRNALDARGYTGGQTRRGRPGEPLLVGWPSPPREVRVGLTVAV